MWASVLVSLMGVSVVFAGMWQNASEELKIENQVVILDQRNEDQQRTLADLNQTRQQIVDLEKTSLEQVLATKQQLSQAQEEVKQTQTQLADQEDKILHAQAQITSTQMTLYGNQNSLAVSESLLVRKINSLNAQTQDAMTAMQTQSQAQAQQEQVPVAPAVDNPQSNDGSLASSDSRRAQPINDDPPQGAIVRAYHGSSTQSQGNDDPNLPQDSRTNHIP